MPAIRKQTPLMGTFKSASKQLDGAQCRVGWFESAKYADGTQVAYIASIQEFGVEQHSLPARPTMRPTMAKEGSEWQKQMGYGATAVTKGLISADNVMEQLGLVAAGDVRKAIAELTEPPLSPTTLLLRKWRHEGRKITGKVVAEAHAAMRGPNPPSLEGVPTKPLVDSSIMVDTLTHDVSRGHKPS